MKIVFITSLFGTGRGNLPGRFKRIDGHDYFLFSDQEQEDFDTDWDVYNISDNPKLSNINGNIRKSRYAKFMGWELLDSMGVYYDCIYYCDVHWSPRADVDWTHVSNTFISEPYPFLQTKHHVCHKYGISFECSLILSNGRDSKDNIAKTLLFFVTKFPEISLAAGQYFENTMFGYFPNPEVKKITRDFWRIYNEYDITYRDQPLWNLLLLQWKFTPQTKPRLRGKFERSGKYGDHKYVKH